MATKEMIRKRGSYTQFKDFYESISACCMDNKQDTTRVLMKVWELLDRNGDFRSRTNSYYAKQSIEQLIEDLDLSE